MIPVLAKEQLLFQTKFIMIKKCIDKMTMNLAAGCIPWTGAVAMAVKLCQL